MPRICECCGKEVATLEELNGEEKKEPPKKRKKDLGDKV